ncbi:glutamate ABC transporter substrate-binding protein [Nocardioides sp. zg-ZUI104]|uniref:glutamate ABC transporter substrate-binding protein n=1 Tax=Nocardioides faecalis TaxID=2803858 RepID=UPI001BCF1A35|nr:glutamate ABC transporter substrate-binding protein [Nocardioides faecalis]MBS4751473.1 glutamate ABC transporter substrate-binding protein [Nocardioides faecalis]
MTRARQRRGSGARLGVLLSGVLALGTLASCGYDDTPLPDKPEAASSSAPPASQVECDDPTKSFAPSDDAAAARAQLGDRGRLVVGVSGDTYQLGFTDPADSRLKGFDIDVAREVADALGVSLQLRVISAGERIGLLESGEIDMVARNMTMNCARWQEVSFSTVYYNATQKVLVRSDAATSYAGPQSLAGKKVCAPAGTTSIANIADIEPEVKPVPANNHTGCLIKFQRGEVDAITGDDTVLAGLVAQDPYAVVPEQKKLTDEPYGLAVARENRALAAFINNVLDRMRGDGTWRRLYGTWLKPYLKVDAAPPKPVYGR